MKTTLITEEQAKLIFEKILNEEISKVSRQDFSRVQFKLEELQSSLSETIKDFRKLQDSIPTGLKNATNKKVTLISSYLYTTQREINQVKESVKTYKKKFYSQQVDEKKL